MQGFNEFSKELQDDLSLDNDELDSSLDNDKLELVNDDLELSLKNNELSLDSDELKLDLENDENNTKVFDKENLINFNEAYQQDLNNKNNKVLVRYNKEPFRKLIFTNFTSQDFNLFMVLCFVANDKGAVKIRLDFKSLCILANKKEKNKKRLCIQINDFAKKCSKIIIKHDKEKSKSYITLFEFIEVFDDFLIFKFNSFMLSIVNNFRFYTQLELHQYCLLKSKFSKQLFLLLMDNLYTKKDLRIRIDDLLEYFDLSGENIRNLEKYISLARTEIKENKLFEYLDYKKEQEVSKAHKIIFYSFIYKK